MNVNWEVPRVRRDRTDGWTYIVQQGESGPVKIGSTHRDPVRRIRELQCGNPEPLRLVGVLEGIYIEPMLHEHFAESHVGGEWYAPWILEEFA